MHLDFFILISIIIIFFVDYCRLGTHFDNISISIGIFLYSRRRVSLQYTNIIVLHILYVLCIYLCILHVYPVRMYVWYHTYNQYIQVHTYIPVQYNIYVQYECILQQVETVRSSAPRPRTRHFATSKRHEIWARGGGVANRRGAVGYRTASDGYLYTYAALQSE